jgi:diguanylate cyclase (GGDEF)-like protein/PAS domain S-box-containing protein
MKEGSSLRTRILLLLLLSVCAALSVAGVMLSFAAKEYHQRRAVAEFRETQEALRDELRRRQLALENLVSALTIDGGIVSSLNMISNYADPTSYQSQVFDPEKRRLARDLSRFAAAGNEISIVALEGDGVVAAFAEKSESSLLEGIVSYGEDGTPSLLVNDGGVRQGWQSGEFPEGADLSRRQLAHEDRFSAFGRSGRQLRQIVSAPAVRFARGDMARTVGRIVVTEPLGEQFLEEFGRAYSLHIAAVLNGPEAARSLPGAPDASLLTRSPDILSSVAPGRDGWYETDSQYVQVYSVSSRNEVVGYFVFTSDKAELGAQVRHMMVVVVLAFVLAALMVLPLGLAWANRSVTRPVDELLASVERIGAGDYDGEAVFAPESRVGEFVRLSSAIRQMASTIRDRESQVRLWAKVMENSLESIFVTDSELRIVLVNAAFTRITGYSAEEAIGQTPRLLKSGRHAPEFYKGMWQSLLNTGHWQGEIWDRAKDGRVFPNLTSITAVKDADGATSHYVAIAADLTEQKEALEHIRYLAQYDPLTQLPNRTLLHDRLSVALATAVREKMQVAVLCLDIDRFKNINDSLGLAAGDELLKWVSEKLLSTVRDTDTVARLTADEFVLVLPALKRPDAAVQVAKSVIAAVGEPLTLAGQSVQIGACIGIALAPTDGRTVDELLRNAEAAMYHAKESGRASYQFFANEMNDRSQQRLRMENDLRQALANGDFSLFYQPQVDIRSGRITGAEALIRWRRNGGESFVSPAEFIPLAEESGLILPIGEWVLQEACRQRVRWRDVGQVAFPIAVNISALQFRQRDFARSVLAVVQEHGIRAGEIELEVTESVVMHDPEEVAAMLARLKGAGFGLAIDDFGTGYSSLAYLKRFALDKLKIDASFVRDIVRDSADLAIVHAVVSLGHSLGLKVVAEGVEGLPELRVLGSMGCDIAQGYHFCRPIPAAEFEVWLAGYVPVPVETGTGTSEPGGGAYLF